MNNHHTFFSASNGSTSLRGGSEVGAAGGFTSPAVHLILREAALADSVKSAALLLARRGLAVFPCNPDKRPLIERGFHSASNDQQQVREWWTRWPDAMLGLPTGGVTGIVVVDLDHKKGKNGPGNLAALHKAECTFTTETAGGGLHLFYQYPGSHVKNSVEKIADGVDVRGDGGYVIFPPSRTPDGAYNLSVSASLARLPLWVCETERQSNRVTEQQKLQKPLVGVPPSVLPPEEAIKATVPTGPGGRNAAIFRFARAMKFECGYGGRPFPEHLPHVQAWHSRALPFITTKDFADTWADYMHGFENATTPLLSSPVDEAWTRAQAEPPPLPDMGFPPDETTRKVYGLVYWLAKMEGGKFYLSVWMVERITSIDHVTAWRRLGIFEAAGILTVVEKGTKGANGKATRYRWTGGPL